MLKCIAHPLKEIWSHVVGFHVCICYVFVMSPHGDGLGIETVTRLLQGVKSNSLYGKVGWVVS